jgi:hypothetical protein
MALGLVKQTKGLLKLFNLSLANAVTLAASQLMF